MQVAGATRSFGFTSEQFTRNPSAPVAERGPSLTMFPPWNVMLRLVEIPDGQSTHQLPAGTTTSAPGEQERPDVVHRVKDPRGNGAPVPPQLVTRVLMYAVGVVGQPFVALQS